MKITTKKNGMPNENPANATFFFPHAQCLHQGEPSTDYIRWICVCTRKLFESVTVRIMGYISLSRLVRAMIGHGRPRINVVIENKRSDMITEHYSKSMKRAHKVEQRRHCLPKKCCLREHPRSLLDRSCQVCNEWHIRCSGIE